MKKSWVKKSLVVGIMILFIGTGVFPTLKGDSEINNNFEQSEKSTTDWWPMFHHDINHTGYSSSKAPNLKLRLWTASTNLGLYASPSVVDDRVFIGSTDGHFYCFDALIGNIIWQFDFYGNQRSPSSAAIVNNKVYFGGVNGYIYCLNASNGAVIWSVFIQTPVPSSILSSPAVVDGRVYIGGGLNDSIFCFDAETGNEIWRFNANFSDWKSPVVVNGKVYINNEDELFCLNALNGSLIRRVAEKYFISSPTIINGKIFLGSGDNNVYCLDADTLEEIWRFHTGDSVESTPAVAYGKVYVGSDDDTLYCLDEETGNLSWTFKTGGDVRSSPAIADDKVFVGSDDSNLYCINAITGNLIWKDGTGGAIASSPAVANGLIFVGSTDGKVYSYRDGEFKIEWVKPLPGGLYIIDHRIVYIKLILRSLIIGPISVTVNAYDTIFGIKNVTFYYSAKAVNVSSQPHDGNNYVWYWHSWIDRPVVVTGVLKAVAINNIGQSLAVEKPIQIVRIGGRGGIIWP
jgi:outer membrane protein assembly factor BamB